MSAGRVLIVTGPPGSGKTTVSALVADRFSRSVHLESDWFFRAIRSGHIEPWKAESHEQNDTVMAAVHDAAAAFARAGYLTIVDGIILPGWYFEWLTGELLGEDMEVDAAILRTSLRVSLARVQGRNSPGLDTAAVERTWRGFADLGPLEHHVFDVDELAPWETAEAILERLESGALAVTG
jgi:cytidylate kinase